MENNDFAEYIRGIEARTLEFERQIMVKAEQLYVLTTELQYLFELHAQQRKTTEACRVIRLISVP